MGPSGIYRPVTWLMAQLVVAVVWLAIIGGPWALTEVARIGAEARRVADLASIEPGQFTVLGSERGVVYGDSISPEGGMAGVFMERQVDGGVEVVISKLGAMVDTDDPDVRLLVLHHGSR